MTIILRFIPTGFLFLVAFLSVQAQRSTTLIQQLEDIVKQEGEIYLAIERYEPQKEKNCRIEDVFTNTLLVSRDSLTVPYTNYTESFCEAFVLRSQFLYRVYLQDIDPVKLVLAQRKYNHGTAKLLEGQASWFEILIATKQDQPLIKRQDIINREMDNVSSMRIIFKTKEGATKALAVLRQIVQENVPR